MSGSLPKLLLGVALCSAVHAQPVAVVDDRGDQVRLAAPAQRIVSLSPGLTETMFRIGAGNHLTAVDEFSDYPLQARRLPRVGSAVNVDMERLLAVRPDLVLIWQSGSSPRLIQRLRAAGLAVYVSEPRRLQDVATTMERLGRLSGEARPAQAAAADFRRQLQELEQRFAGQQPVSVFYQVWPDPLITVNGSQFIGKAIALCGGRNVFSDLAASAPQVTLESVLARDPQVMVAGAEAGQRDPLARWRRWPQLRAVRQGQLYIVPADLMQRPGPRLLEGARILCAQLAHARSTVQPR